MRRLFRSNELDTFVAERSHINPVEKPFSFTEEDRCNNEVKFVNEPRSKVLFRHRYECPSRLPLLEHARALREYRP